MANPLQFLLDDYDRRHPEDQGAAFLMNPNLARQGERQRALSTQNRRPLRELIEGFGEGMLSDDEQMAARGPSGSVMAPEAQQPLRQGAFHAGKVFNFLPSPSTGAMIAAAPIGVVKKLSAKAQAEALRKAEEFVGPPLPELAGPPWPPQLMDRHKTTTAARILNKTNKDSGYTVSLPTGEIPTEGYMMGQYKNADPRNLVTDKLTQALIRQQVEKNAIALSKPEAHLGTWKDSSPGGKIYVDVAKRYDTQRAATKAGERTKQKAGWDLNLKQEFPVGDWEKFIQSPEFNRRMHELNAEGAAYQMQTRGAESQITHGSPEWWKGSTFERVYGPQNQKQVAGFTASTAPNQLLRPNVQQMTEYMRRHITGEDIIQPEWRAGEGLMTWKPGAMIGMEEGRANNLRKSAAGQLDQLQENKVREEAAAMMGDPNAAPLDRYWARVAEDPEQGIFTATDEGVVPPGKPYEKLKTQVWTAADEAGLPIRSFSANVWTAIRERIRMRGELYGQMFRRGAAGESKSYDEHFQDLIAEKAKHLGISIPEMEKRLGNGDANLLALIAASPLLAPVLADVLAEQSGGTQELQ